MAALCTLVPSLAAQWAVRPFDLDAETRPWLVPTDLEPLVLNDPLARRAVLDFVKADANCSGGLTLDGAPRRPPGNWTPCDSRACGIPDFARTFGLSADLFLGCVIAEMDDSSYGFVDLREFLGARQKRCTLRDVWGVSPPLLPPDCIVGMSQFFVNSQEERNARLRDFAFNMMDVAGCGYVDKVRVVLCSTHTNNAWHAALTSSHACRTT